MSREANAGGWPERRNRLRGAGTGTVTAGRLAGRLPERAGHAGGLFVGRRGKARGSGVAPYRALRGWVLHATFLKVVAT